MAISIAVLAARSYRSVSRWICSLLALLLPWTRPGKPPILSALSPADRQMLRILSAASMSPSGHWMGSSQISLCSLLPNHRIALPRNGYKHRAQQLHRRAAFFRVLPARAAGITEWRIIPITELFRRAEPALTFAWTRSPRIGPFVHRSVSRKNLQGPRV